MTEVKSTNRLTRTGAEIITERRRSQIGDHGRSATYDAHENANGELLAAAVTLINSVDLERRAELTGDVLTSQDVFDACLIDWPGGWRSDSLAGHCDDDREKRLATAGAFIAAELDRIRLNRAVHNVVDGIDELTEGELHFVRSHVDVGVDFDTVRAALIEMRALSDAGVNSADEFVSGDPVAAVDDGSEAKSE